MTELKPDLKLNLTVKTNEIISSIRPKTIKLNLAVKEISSFAQNIEDSANGLVETENELASTKLSNVMVLGTNRLIDQSNCKCTDLKPCISDDCPKNSF